MKLIILLLMFLSCINRYYFFSKYLERKDITGKTNLTFNVNTNKSIRYNIIEIFNQFNAFIYSNESGHFTVNEVIEIFPNNVNTKNISLSPINGQVTLWVRVIGITDLYPGGCSNNPKVAVKQNIWSITLSASASSAFNKISSEWQCKSQLKYAIYGLPIYPLGNIDSWSTDYKNTYSRKEEIVQNLINNSIESVFLEQNGDLLYNNYAGPDSISYTLANRMNRDFIVIIVAYGPNDERVQYPPIYVSGCLSNKDVNSNCKLSKQSYPMYIVLGCAILFVFIAIKHDLIQVLFCGWITTCVVAMVVWTIYSRDTYLSDTTLYVIWFGIGPGTAFFCVLLLYLVTKKYNRIRMFFSAFVLTMILLSIMWFTPLKLYAFDKKIIFWSVSGTVALLFMVLLSVFNHLTRIIGGIFLSTVLISLSCSVNNLNASIIPFIFIDFYNSILFSSPAWIYYSLLLKEDLIIIIICPILSILVGSIFYIMFKRSEKKNVIPQVYTSSDRPEVTGNENYGSIPLQRPGPPQVICNIVVNAPVAPPSTFSDPPPSYKLNATTSTTAFNNPQCPRPPSYATCLKAGVEPSAPSRSACNGSFSE